MSLIADALKKADAPSEQRRQDAPPPFPENSAPKSHAVYRLALVGCVGLVLLGIAQVTRRPARVAPVQTAHAVSETPKKSAPAGVMGKQLLRTALGEMALTGTLRSADGKSLALINNEVVGQGDQVRGMTVVQVNPDSVELQDDGGKTKTLKLED